MRGLLKHRRGKGLAVAASLGVVALAGWWLWPEDLFFPRLRPAAAADPVTVVVGENVHVSKPHERIAFTECVLAADPNRANRLFASSLYWPHPAGTSLVGYLSDDGGRTWAPSLERVADRGKKERFVDPTAAFGPGGELYLVYLRVDDAKAGAESIGAESGGSLQWLCLPAGGRAWEERGRIDRHIDRPWLAVDQTAGPNRGRLYCTGNVGRPYFITSPDGGRTFGFPEVPYSSPGAVYPAPPVVLAGGSLLAAFRWFRHRGSAWQPEYFPTFRSTDGGRGLTADAFVSNWKHPDLTPDMRTTQGPSFPQLAADPGSPRFTDNVYIVWAQRFGNRPATEWVLFSRSTDRGRSWSAPVSLSEQPEVGDPAQDYLAYLPCVAVNKAGVVAVTWYDRRGLPPAGGGGATKGWNVRIRVSLDGGATWAPSVPVTTEPSTGKLTGWHTAGLAADAAGQFHPAWIDDRTGRPQLWTAAVRVR